MMRKFLPLSGVLGVALLLMFIITGNQSYAQVTSSAINGRITDTKGENLPGATVIAIHEPSGTRYGTTTNSEGLYNLPTVRVGGPYKVTVSFVGYAEQSATNIFANLGAAATVNVQLSDGGTQLTEVTIQGTRDGFTGQRTGAATAFNARQILTLPTVSRDIGDITRLTPQSNGNSFGGRDGRYNNYQVDGANFNNGFGLNGNPLPGGGGVSIDAIDEVQVNIAPYDVRQSGFSGAGINAVTRSGTNTFSGSAYTFWRNQNQVGSKSGDVTIEKPVSSARTIGFRLGGPLVKNKLFFFVNAEHIENKGAASGAVNLWKASETGASNPDQNITRVRRSDLEAVRSHLINQWGYDPGAYENYANDNSEKTTSLLARLDWNISDRHKLAIRYNQVESSTPSLVNGNSGPYPRSTTANRVSQLSMAFANTMYTQKNIVRSVSAELNSTINNKLSNQFLATYSRIQSVRTSPSSEFPMIDIGDGTGSATNYVNYITAGYELFTYGNDVLNDNINITNNLTYVTGKHNFTGGVSFEYQSFGNQYLRSGTSYYRYNSVADFLTTGTANEKAPLQFALTYPYAGQDTYAPAKYGLPSAYIQDKIQVNNKLTLTVGLRAELPMFLNKLTPNTVVDTLKLLGVDGQPRTYSTGSWPKARVMLSPRIGFRYDVKEDGGFVVRGGTGIFTGRVPFVWLTNMPSNSGVIQNTIEPGSYAASSGWINNIRFQPDKYYWLNNPPAGGENVFIQNPNAGVPSSLALVDRNFKMPQVWRSSLGADYVIPGTPFVITADLMYTKDLQGVYQFGANRKAATQKMNYAGDTRDFYPNAASYTYNSRLGGNAGSVLTNTTKGHSFNATVGVTLRQTKGFYGSLFYSHTTAKTISDNPGSNASSAWGSSPNINNPNDLTLYTSSNALPSRIVGNLSYRFEYLKHLATTITIYYNGANRGRYSFQYNGDLNGDGISADLLYVPNSASELNFANLTVGTGANAVTFTAEQQRAAFDQYVNNVEVLRNSKGGYVDRNAGLLPWVNNFDFRLLQDIFTNIGKQRHSLQFSLDIMNVGNLLNKNWGIQQELITGSNNVLRRSAVTAAGVPTFTMNTVSVNGQTILPTTPFRNVTTTATTWSMQFGLRYLF